MTIGYGEFIKRHRLLSGFKSQRSLAQKTGIDNSSISRIELEVHKPERRTLQTLAEYLTSTSFSELMEVCGYHDHNHYVDTIDITNELTDIESVRNLNISVDNLSLTDEELKAIITYVRVYRKS